MTVYSYSKANVQNPQLNCDTIVIASVNRNLLRRSIFSFLKSEEENELKILFILKYLSKISYFLF